MWTRNFADYAMKPPPFLCLPLCALFVEVLSCVSCISWLTFPANAQEASVHTIAVGPEWIPLEYRRDILPGSALDFSGMGIHDAPAGKYGWLVSRNGHAEFERRPGVPARFYGVNLCTTANYLSDEEVERVTDRLVRLGYNALRIHHHDDAWAKDSPSRARLDVLMAACIRKGIYLTTDLYVSRKCTWRELGIDRDGDADMQSAKLQMMVTDAGFVNWKRFARDFLTHVNPRTGRCLAEEPAMPLLVIVNESSPHSDWDKAKSLPEFRSLWPKWLAEVRAENPKAFPTASPDEFPEKGGWWDPSPENSAKAAFWAWVCERFSERAAAFLCDELGVKALLATENNGPTLPQILKMRSGLGGYVDFHYYTEHANSASKAERDETGLPLTGVFRNHNPLDDRWHTYPGFAVKRVWGCPLVVSESQMGGPNFNRAMAGLLTGAFASVQDWTGIWTFAYAHNREKLFDGIDSAPGRFDLSLDPLMQATDRLPMLLFLRGDQATPKAAFADYISNAAMRADAEGEIPLPRRPTWVENGLEWRARLGVAFEGDQLPEGVKGLDAMKNANEPSAHPDAPPCGVKVDGEKGEIVVSGPRTCGGFVQDGGSFKAGALTAKVSGHSALVAATALNGDSLSDASRILVWHLTDLHGDGFSWGGKIVKSQFWPHVGILNWGSSHLLLHAGEAEVVLKIGNDHKSSLSTNDTNLNDNPVNPVEKPLCGSAPLREIKTWRVHALGTDGRRECEVPCEWVSHEDTRTPGGRTNGALRFTASSRQPFGGCLYYEVVRE